MLPPILAVTTGAAVAAGPMIQVRTLSHRTFCQQLLFGITLDVEDDPHIERHKGYLSQQYA